MEEYICPTCKKEGDYTPDTTPFCPECGEELQEIWPQEPVMPNIEEDPPFA